MVYYKFAKDKRNRKKRQYICNLLREKGKHVPDQRLGRFLLSYIFVTNPFHHNYIFLKKMMKLKIN